MIPEKCPYFESCDAPICPMNLSDIAIWYPNEKICKNKEFKNMNLIITQKKISKINKKHEVQGIFTYNMLNKHLKIYKNISGINEDLPIEEFVKSEKAWIKKHKGLSKKTKLKLQSNLVKKLEVRKNEI